MKIEIEIDEKNFEEPFRVAIARVINERVTSEVNKQLGTFKDRLSTSIEKYIASKIGNEKIQSLIDEAIERVVDSKMDER